MANENRKSSFKKALTFVDLGHIPGPRGFEYFNYVKSFQENILKAFTSVHQDYGAIASFPWPMNSIIIYDPDLIKTVLVDDAKKYIKGEQIEELKAVVGNGLATNNDHKSWVRNRGLVSREFAGSAVNNAASNICEITDRHISDLKEGDIDFCHAMKFLTFDIACKIFLGIDASGDIAKKVNDAVEYNSIVIYERIFHLFPLPYWLPTKKHREFSRHFKNLETVVAQIIDQAKKSEQNQTSALARLLYAKDENNEGLSPSELRDEILTIMLAGHETSAHTLMWFFALMAKNQSTQDEIYNEVKDISNFNVDSLMANTPKLQMALHEAMRLYPAFPVLSRKTKTATKLGDYDLPANTNVVIPIYVTQRSEKFWDSPLEFKLHRFDDEKLKKSYKYLPFSRGQRRCVAEVFAMTEMIIVIAKYLKKFSLELTSSDIPPEVAAVSLKPDAGELILSAKLRA